MNPCDITFTVEPVLNYILVNRSGFDNLLQDDVFVDYLNKFMALPVFGQRMIYRKKQDKAGLPGQLSDNHLIR